MSRVNLILSKLGLVFDKFGRRNALIPLERILNFPVNCCGIEYVARAIGPIKYLIKSLSITS